MSSAVFRGQFAFSRTAAGVREQVGFRAARCRCPTARPGGELLAARLVDRLPLDEEAPMLLLHLVRQIETRAARRVRRQRETRRHVVHEPLLADRHPAERPDLGATTLTHDLDLLVGAQAEDQRRPALEQRVHHALVRELGLLPVAGTVDRLLGPVLPPVLTVALFPRALNAGLRRSLRERIGPIDDAALAVVLVREAVEDDDLGAGRFGGMDRLNEAAWLERRPHVGVQEPVLLGVVQAAARLGVDESDLARGRDALSEPQGALGLAGAGCAGECDEEGDLLADGGGEGEAHAASSQSRGRCGLVRMS